MKITWEVFEIGNLFSPSFKKESFQACSLLLQLCFVSLRFLRKKKKKRLNASVMPPALLTCIKAALPPDCLPSVPGIFPFCIPFVRTYNEWR